MMKVDPYKTEAIAEALGYNESEAIEMAEMLLKEATPEEKSAIDDMMADLRNRTGFEPMIDRFMEVK